MNNLQEKIKKAKEAGYSDQEIAEFLNKRGENVTTTANPMLNPVTNPNYIDPTNTGGVAALPDYAANMVRGAGQQVKDIGSLLAKPVTDPRGTMNFVNSLSRRMNPVTGLFESIKQAPNDINMAKGLGSYYKEQYGGGEEILRKLINDPAGVLSDIAMVGTLAGGVSKGSANIASAAGKGKTAAKLSQAGTELLKGSEAIDPLSMSSKMLSKGVSTAPITKVGKNTLLESFVKRGTRQLQEKDILNDIVGDKSKTLASRYADQVEKVPTNVKRGIKQEAKVIEEGENALNTLLDNGTELANRRVNIEGILTEMRNTARLLEENLGKSSKPYLDQIKTLEKKAQTDLINGTTVALKDANDMRKFTDKFISKTFEQTKGLGENSVAVQAMQDKANALRAAVNEAAPEVAEVNNRLSTAYEMQNFFTGLRRGTERGLIPTKMESLLLAGGMGYALPQALSGNVAPAAFLGASIPIRRLMMSPNVPLTALRTGQEGRNLIKRLLETADLGTNTGRVTRGASVLNSSQGNVR